MDAVLKTSTKEVWEEHIEYVLGDRVKGRAMTGLDGSIKKTPSWHLNMHYEGKIRDKAATLINESPLKGGERYDIASALKEARQCRETRDEEFEDKFRLQQEAPKTKNKARGSNDRSPSASPPIKRIKGDKGKGKGRGRGGDRDPKIVTRSLLRDSTTRRCTGRRGARQFATPTTIKVSAPEMRASCSMCASSASAMRTAWSTAQQSDK